MPKNNAQNPSDAAMLDSIETELAAGGDPFGDDEPIVPETIEMQAQKAAAGVDDDDSGDEANDEPTTDETVVDADALAAIAGTDEPIGESLPTDTADDAPSPQQFRTADKAVLDSERTILLAQDAEAFKKVMDGEMEPGDYAALRGEIGNKLDTLLIQRTLIEANAQNKAQLENASVRSIMDNAKQSGEIDYFTDIKGQKQFDMALQMLLADPDNAGRTFSAVTKEAHASVLALRGVAAKPAATLAATTAATKPAARVPEKPPITLRGLPSASTPNTTTGIAEAMGRLRGAAYQDAFAKLTPAQQSALVD